MKKFVAAVVLSIASLSAMADSNFYGAIDLGQTKAQSYCDGLSAGWTCKNTATALRIAGGYQITPTWGVEASYGNYGTLKASGPVFAATVNSETKLSGFAVHAIGTLPINEAFSLFGKLGIARTTGKASGTSSSPSVVIVGNEVSSTKASFGVGAQYALTKTVALRAQYDDFGSVGDSNTGTMKISLLSAGIVVKF